VTGETGAEVLDHGSEYWVGDGSNSAVYQAELLAAGWYVRAWVDCEHFVEDLTYDGPYDTMKLAEDAGRNAAIEWCMNNDVAWENDDESGES
jgi:hypothetical protein